MTASLPPLVSTSWLAERLGHPGLRVVDGSWYLGNSGRDAASEFLAGHIPGAVFFDLDASSDAASSLPHMLPSEAAFAERMSALGLHDSDDIVVYDASGKHFSAPRVWWMFRVFGHPRTAVLDGGLGQWQREGRPLEQGIPQPVRGHFTAKLDRSAVRTLAAVHANLARGDEQVVDARGPGRFAATDPEPRAGIRGGHIPGSRNVPYETLVRPDGTLRSPAELRAVFERAGVDLSRPLVTTCGSGVTACTLLLGLHQLGHDRVAVYDGAWTEWGGSAETPVETGPAPAVTAT